MKKTGVEANNKQYMFSSQFEERMVFEYLRNVMDSNFIHSKGEQIIDAFSEFAGRKIIARLVEVDCPEIQASEGFSNWVNGLYSEHRITGPRGAALIKNHMLPYVLRHLKSLSSKSSKGIEERLVNIRKSFNLSSEEIAVLTFYFIWRTCGAIQDAFNGARASIVDMSDMMKLKTLGHVVLGIPRKSFLKIFEPGILFHAGIMERGRGSNVELSQWCSDYLCGLGGANLSNEFFTMENNEPLKLSDFDVSEDDLLVLDGLMKNRTSSNILFYGTAGTGKTSFTSSLAKHCQKKLYSVKVSDTDSIKERLRAIYAAVNLAGEKDSLVLVDEADEILNTEFGNRGENFITKSWINTFLDSHGKKVVWISNRSHQIDLSTMRRFSFSLEFKPFTHDKRLKVLKYALSAKGVPDGYFAEEELKDLCRVYAVNAAGIVGAVESVAIDARTNKLLTLRKIKTILKNHEKAIGNTGTVNNTRSFESYSLEGLNATVNLSDIVNAVKKNMNQTALIVSGPSVSILLYGLPGTGKSEFVNYLGYVLGREVLLRRASDIQSKWVGQTEKNIAAAFLDAQERGVVLFFDEADTFLFPRSSAMRSWEKSFTNEILTQLESHRGVVVFATNDVEGLDHAALRRFGFKIRLDPLTPDGKIMFYKSLLMPLLQEQIPLTPNQLECLRRIPSLTPGDYAVVRNQLMLMGSDNTGHDKLITALENEVSYKKNDGKAIGF